MGRIKSAQVKKTSKKIFDSHRSKFSPDFAENKKGVSQLIESSKKVRNCIAGYVTRLAKKSKK